VACALEVLADEGVAGIKIPTLCKRLGVTKGSFYWHFSDLEAFLFAVAEHWAAERDEAVASFAALDAVEPTRRLPLMLMRFADTSAWPLERAVREWARTNPWVRERLAQSDAVMGAKVREAFRGLGFSESEAEVRSEILFRTGVGFMLTVPDGAELDLTLGQAMLTILTRP
jgi:AcrR family transcriptional regulator